jgi:hypothetical protein
MFASMIPIYWRAGRSDRKTCRERHATPWFVERLGIDCDRLLRERLWKLYDEGFGRASGPIRTPRLRRPAVAEQSRFRNTRLTTMRARLPLLAMGTPAGPSGAPFAENENPRPSRCGGAASAGGVSGTLIGEAPLKHLDTLAYTDLTAE